MLAMDTDRLFLFCKIENYFFNYVFVKEKFTLMKAVFNGSGVVPMDDAALSLTSAVKKKY